MLINEIRTKTFSRQNTPNEFYVYVYMRPDGSYYYVGKGKGVRAWNHSRKERIKAQPDNTKIVIVAHGLSENEAHQLEVKLIKLHGRKDIGTGILRNITNGGEGASGLIVSPENKKAMSDRMTGEKNHMKLPKHRLRQSEKMKGTNHPLAKSIDLAAAHHVRMSGSANPSKNNPEFSARQSKMMRGNNPMYDPATVARRDLAISGENHYTRQPGYTPKKIECPHCGMLNSTTNHLRWHGDKCKQKSI